MYNFVMGGFSGCVAITFSYPLDLIRRRMQLSGMEGQVAYKNMFDCGYQICKLEGAKGLFKGLAPCYVKVAQAMAIMFWCNENLKKFLNV
jgi:solute carrier family 25 (mitochondrial phosphate transporter), member 23/24/25/41